MDKNDIQTAEEIARFVQREQARQKAIGIPYPRVTTEYILRKRAEAEIEKLHKTYNKRFDEQSAEIKIINNAHKRDLQKLGEFEGKIAELPKLIYQFHICSYHPSFDFCKQCKDCEVGKRFLAIFGEGGQKKDCVSPDGCHTIEYDLGEDCTDCGKKEPKK